MERKVYIYSLEYPEDKYSLYRKNDKFETNIS